MDNFYNSIVIIFIIVILVYFYKEFNKNNNIDKGYVVVPNVLNHDKCDALKNVIDITRMVGTKYGNINSNVNREDMMIPLEYVKIYIKEIYEKTKHIWLPVLGENPLICECSTLISHFGAQPQIWHTDTYYTKGDAPLISIGIALTDIDEDMGPLHVFENSNKFYTDEKELKPQTCDRDNIERGLCSQSIQVYCEDKGLKIKKCTAKKGSLVAWMSSTVHRGSGNVSHNERPVFYFSLLSQNGNPPGGSTYSLTTNRVTVNSL